MPNRVPQQFYHLLNYHEKYRRFHWNVDSQMYDRCFEGFFIITFWSGQCRMMCFDRYVLCMYLDSIRATSSEMLCLIQSSISYGPACNKLLDLRGLDYYCGPHLDNNLYPTQQPPIMTTLP